MDAHNTERRLRRSDDTRTALGYQLDRVRVEASLDAIVLADAWGLPLAGSGDGEACSELAAIAPFAGTRRSVPRGARFERAFVHVRAVSFEGVALYLAACSDSIAHVWSARLETWLAEAQQGVTRILAA